MCTRLALLILLLSILPLRAASAQAAAPSDVPMLQPGDMLKVEVWRKAELSGELKVGADSTLIHPLYKNLKVAGIPFDVAAERIRQVLLQYEENPEFVLQPEYSVYIGGAVDKPGLYYLTPETTITRALVEAGGSLSHRNLQRVRLLRGGRSKMLNLTKQSGGPVLSGDQIFVEGNLVSHVVRNYITPASGLLTTAIFAWQLIRGIKIF